MLDFRNNPLRIFAAHELASIIDPAMATKMTVQFNLFGGTVLKLGTERHHSKLLKGKADWRARLDGSCSISCYIVIKILSLCLCKCSLQNSVLRDLNLESCL